MNPSFAQRLAVCSWSLQPAGPRELAKDLAQIGINRVQIALDPLREHPEIWGDTAEILKAHGIQIVSGMFGTIGEDYSTIESIRRTGGVVPDETWSQNWKNIQRIAEIARHLRLSLITFHAGFLPHDDHDPDFRKLLERIAQIADLFWSRHIFLGFETGQETAETLRVFLQKLNKANVGVNFDPANMILYDKGDPIAALKMLGPWLKQCHIKDARRTRLPGAWGEEVAAGTGEVDWPSFFQTLDRFHFSGYLAIEREAGNQRLEDIKTARKLVEAVARA